MVDFSTSRKGLSPSLQIPSTVTCDASISNNPKMDWCNILYFNYGHNVTFDFDYTLSRFNDYFVTHKTTRSTLDLSQKAKKR